MTWLKRIKERVRPRWLKTARKLAVSRFRLQRLTRKFGLRPLDGNPLAALKSSDTLFILGSGGSINDLGTDEWRQIAEADSVGFNFWLVHDFVPSLFVFEPIKPHVPDRQLIFANLRARAGDYAGTPLLLKDGERFKPEFMTDFLAELPAGLLPNTGLSWDWELPEESRAAFTEHLLRLDRRGWLTRPGAPLARKRASIFFLVLLGLRAGYKRIVLCGVDLSNTPYFYESRRAEYEAKGRAVPRPVPSPAGHQTDDPNFGAMTISSALEILNDKVLKRHGSELYVAFKSSRLHPMLPSYFGR